MGIVEPRYNERPRDWHNLFAKTRFRYMEVLFHIFYYYLGKESRSLNRGLRYIEVCYIEVLQYVVLFTYNQPNWLKLRWVHSEEYPFISK